MPRSREEIHDDIMEMLDRINKMMESVESMISELNEALKPRYALDFDKQKYLDLGFLESAKWVADILAKKMLKRMETDKEKKFSGLLKMKSNWKTIGVRTCARFNRGEYCYRGQWHTSLRRLTGGPDGQVVEQQQREDLRIHACTLCLVPISPTFFEQLFL
jgi:hypothetical protein